jgi:uncharacterized protein (TIGR03435 family)
MRFDRPAKREALLRSLKNAAILMISTSAVTVAYSQSVAGTWQGTMPSGENARVMLKIVGAGDEPLHGFIIFVDRSAVPYPLLSARYRAPELSLTFGEFSFRGKLSADGKSIAGTWTQGNRSYPLTLALATPETLWTYSGPPMTPMMSTSADPSFEVATIKPGLPDAKNFGYKWQTRLFQARDNTVADLIRFAYQVRPRQIDGGPDWTRELGFDITGEPDAPGLPSLDQQRLMLKKLLAKRFGLKLHIVQRDFPVYALVVEKRPPKIKASDPGGSHMSINLRELEDGNTAVQFSYTTIPEFVDLLMNFIQDRQVVDKTGLTGRFDFTMMIPTSTLSESDGDGDADKTVAFLVAVQPLSFKLLPKREQLEVIVIDQVNKPTAN